jgi:hypothetical protein
MDLDSFLVAVDVMVDDWWQAHDAVALQATIFHQGKTAFTLQ